MDAFAAGSHWFYFLFVVPFTSLGAVSGPFIGPAIKFLGGEEASVLPMMVIQLVTYLFIFSGTGLWILQCIKHMLAPSLFWFVLLSIPLRFAGRYLTLRPLLCFICAVFLLPYVRAWSRGQLHQTTRLLLLQEESFCSLSAVR